MAGAEEGCLLRCSVFRMHKERITNRGAEFAELKNDSLIRVRPDSQQAGNSLRQTPGHDFINHSRGFLGERFLFTFRQIMADHLQREVSIARNVQPRIFGRARLAPRDELD
jgi:hypothetical protein